MADRVLVKTVPEETATSSGILIPTSATKKQNAGEVVAVGPGALEDGKPKALSLKVVPTPFRTYSCSHLRSAQRKFRIFTKDNWRFLLCRQETQ